MILRSTADEIQLWVSRRGNRTIWNDMSFTNRLLPNEGCTRLLPSGFSNLYCCYCTRWSSYFQRFHHTNLFGFCKLFSAALGNAGNLRLENDADVKDKTAFVTHHMLNRYKRMPFGFKHSTRYINVCTLCLRQRVRIFHGYFWTTILSFHKRSISILSRLPSSWEEWGATVLSPIQDTFLLYRRYRAQNSHYTRLETRSCDRKWWMQSVAIKHWHKWVTSNFWLVQSLSAGRPQLFKNCQALNANWKHFSRVH